MIIGSKPFTKVLKEPLQRVPYLQLKAKQFYETGSQAMNDSFSYFKSRFATITSKALLILIIELLIILSLHFYALPALPIWYLIVPFISMDYLIVIAAVSFYFCFLQNPDHAAS